jgi:hypothetical protein
MIDLETLGNRSYAPIIQIGACFFDINTGNTGPSALYSVSLDSNLKYGLNNFSGNTFYWWLGQSEESRKNAIEVNEYAKDLKDSLINFKEFIRLKCEEDNIVNLKDLHIWGNSNRFDMGLLANAYEKCGLGDPFWNFRLERDVRTLVWLNPDVKKNHTFDRVGHNGLDDCFNQVSYLYKTYKTIKIIQDEV